MEYNLPSVETNTPIEYQILKRPVLSLETILTKYRHHQLIYQLQALCELHFRDGLISRNSLQQKLRMRGLESHWTVDDQQIWAFDTEPKPHFWTVLGTEENVNDERLLFRISNSLCLVLTKDSFYYC